MIRTAAALFTLTLVPLAAPAADPPARPSPDDLKAVVRKGYDAIKARQNADGSVAPKLGGPGVTALACAALVRNGYTPDDPVVAKMLAYLEKSVKPDGGVYDQGLANYTTCLAVVAFKEANTNKKYDAVIAAAAKFARTMQSGESDPAALAFGGASYTGTGRPDLSNTQFFIEALTASGAGADDPAVKKALAFVTRSQNLPGEVNKEQFAKAASDDDKGGFVYNPHDQSDPKSRKRTAAGGLRSEGGMTYAGLKSFLYAGVSKDDPRVKAAVKWIARHYTLKENPGQGTTGLYYYYHTFAKAMTALGDDVFTDDKGTKHPWRSELFDALKAAQKPDGTWANANAQFFENQPELSTAFALLALSYCK